ncbi:MAG: Sir2 family NAD-dependent protein deacetylase, partial [Deltaproteobacteria bacterium]|nr:Sir2 family NAD-dependent protein deacetylase [Deltaproteobacteria bacterium]
MEEAIKRAARDLADSRYAIALTGAGISTESGIPDYRGPSGVWTKNPERERKAYRSYELFLQDPKEYWKERLTTPSALGNLEASKPNKGHYALAELETLGVLKWVITQNVDALHEKAGNRNLLEYHGNSLKLRCIACSARFPRDQFDLMVLLNEDRLPPLCPQCGGIIKSDGVGFGEPIPTYVAEQSMEEAIKRAARDLADSRYAIALTGAGI